MIKLSLLAKAHLQEDVETGLNYYYSERKRFNEESREFLSSRTAEILEKQITTRIEMYEELKYSLLNKIEVINE